LYKRLRILLLSCMPYPSLFFRICLFGVMIWLLASNGCRYEVPCDPTREPYCHLTFTYDSAFSPYQKAFLPQSLRPQNYVDLTSTDSLPFSLRSDTTVFVLQSPERIDTIGLRYVRNIQYQTKECGLVITLESFRILPFTTIPANRLNLEILPRRAGGYQTRASQTQYILSVRP